MDIKKSSNEQNNSSNEPKNCSKKAKIHVGLGKVKTIFELFF